MKKTMVNVSIPLYIAVEIESKETYESLWFPLPVTKACFYDMIGSSWDEIRISEYETTIPGFSRYRLMETPFSVVNHLAARLNTLNDEQALKLTAIMSNILTQFRTAEQIIDYTYYPDKYALIPGISTHWELGQRRIEELDMSGLPPAIIQSIDEIRFGSKIACQEDGWFTSLGYISSKNGWDKPAKNRRVPAQWDVRTENGEEIYGWIHDDSEEEMELDDEV